MQQLNQSEPVWTNIAELLLHVATISGAILEIQESDRPLKTTVLSCNIPRWQTATTSILLELLQLKHIALTMHIFIV